MSKTVYLISGLGVDERVLSRLRLEDYRMVYLPWLVPKKRESISDYAARMAEKIEANNPVILGLSFGAMLALEIAKLRPVKQVIVVSSAKTRQELPWYFRLAGRMRLHWFVPTFLYKRSNLITYWLFGVKGKESRSLLRAILKDTDSRFIRWAIPQVLFWNNQQVPKNCIHLHGKADKLLPAGNIEEAQLIDKAGHFMIWENANEINNLLNQLMD